MARLNCDVIFLATADEETSGDASIRMLIAKHWEKLAAGFASNEGGNVSLTNGKGMRSMDTADRGEHAQRVISDASPLWNAMLRNTIAPTVVTAGVANNVIPAEARANLNVRLLPGDPIAAVMNDLHKLVNDPQVKLELQPNAGLAAPSSSLESDFYGVISKVVAQEFGGAPALPFQSTLLTESAELRLHQVQAYGMVPFPLAQEDLKRMHGDDEGIPLASFDKGVGVLAKIVSEFAVAH